MRMLLLITWIDKMKVVELNTKHAVVFQDTIVHTGTLPQCNRFIRYMEGSSDEQILSRKELIKLW